MTGLAGDERSGWGQPGFTVGEIEGVEWAQRMSHLARRAAWLGLLLAGVSC